jgi:Ca2+/H+ antiporter, TMEM165/GDT1 family
MENIMNLKRARKKFWIKRAIFFPIALAAGLIIFGSVVMYLWNAVLPGVLGVHTITFLQAIGILILSKILFGGFPNRRGHRGFDIHRKELREKWMNLSPEEKERMREKLWNRFEPKDKDE